MKIHFDLSGGKPSFYNFFSYMFNIHANIVMIFDHHQVSHNKDFIFDRNFRLNMISHHTINEKTVLENISSEMDRNIDNICYFIGYYKSFYEEIFQECDFNEHDAILIAKMFKLSEPVRNLLKWTVNDHRPFDFGFRSKDRIYQIFFKPEYSEIKNSEIIHMMTDAFPADERIGYKVQMMNQSYAANKKLFIIDKAEDLYLSHGIVLEYPPVLDIKIDGITLDELIFFFDDVISQYFSKTHVFSTYPMTVDIADVKGMEDGDWYYFNGNRDTFNYISSTGRYEIVQLKKDQVKIRDKSKIKAKKKSGI